MREGSKVIGIWFVGVFVLLVTVGLVYLVKPYFVARDRAVIQQSHAYQVSRETALYTLKADYDKLEVTRLSLNSDDQELKQAVAAQQAGILRQMHHQAVLMRGPLSQDMADFFRMTGGR